MSYEYQSKHHADLAESLVITDLINKGWSATDSGNRDSIYDVLVDISDRSVVLSNTVITVVQVKYMDKDDWLIPTWTRGTGKDAVCRSEHVSTNGKARNRRSYAVYGVPWLVGVKIAPVQFFYYYIDTYRHYDAVDIRVVPPQSFPINTNIKSHCAKQPRQFEKTLDILE